jgi:hypothetical protein
MNRGSNTRERSNTSMATDRSRSLFRMTVSNFKCRCDDKSLFLFVKEKNEENVTGTRTSKQTPFSI